MSTLPIYRAWHKSEKRMFRVDAVYISENKVGEYIDGAPESEILHNVSDVELMLCIDNDPLVYEGDIIEVDGCKYVVSLYTGGAVCKYWAKDYRTYTLDDDGEMVPCTYEDFVSYWRIAYGAKVIGNIYENKELYKQIQGGVA